MPTSHADALPADLHEAIAPGKVILSGEHAVVYGAPALVTAASLYARAVSAARTEPVLAVQSPQEDFSCEWPLAEAMAKLAAVRSRHLLFLQDSLSIRDVLPNILELLPLAAAVVLERMPLPTGVTVRLTMEMPIGSGMGSSAAGALAVQSAVAAALGVRRSRDEALADAMTCERWIHGRPSGVDAYICLRGGTVRFDGEEPEFVPLADRKLILMHTGRPSSTTGECVAAVRNAGYSMALWENFAAATLTIEAAFRESDHARLLSGVRANHRLLTHIGVVPATVQQAVATIEGLGGAAKIAGAGSIRGDGGGMLWCIGDLPWEDLAATFGYSLFRLEGGVQGARICDSDHSPR